MHGKRKREEKFEIVLDKEGSGGYNMCCVQRQQVSYGVNPAESAVKNNDRFTLFVSLCANSVLFILWR